MQVDNYCALVHEDTGPVNRGKVKHSEKIRSMSWRRKRSKSGTHLNGSSVSPSAEAVGRPGSQAKQVSKDGDGLGGWRTGMTLRI